MILAKVREDNIFVKDFSAIKEKPGLFIVTIGKVP